MRFLFLAILFLHVCSPMDALLPAPSKTISLLEKFQKAQSGDFIVTEQSKTYSLLLIRSISSSTLLLEEINVPANAIDLSKISWKEWIESKAPHHTSWLMYEIDLSEKKLVECFSFTRSGWIFLDESEHFFSQLLSLPLNKTLDEQRRKVGPPPLAGETDRRPLWNPPLRSEGKKQTKPDFDVWRTEWPNDSTRLSGSTVELFFDANTTFPFPYWIEVNNGHYAYKIRVIDSGSGLSSPMPILPKRPPQFLGQPKKLNEKLRLSMRSPKYYKKLNLFAIDLAHQLQPALPIPSVMTQGEKPEEIFLDISLNDLKSIFTEGHRYRWVAIPEDSYQVYSESEEPFLWKNF